MPSRVQKRKLQPSNNDDMYSYLLKRMCELRRRQKYLVDAKTSELNQCRKYEELLQLHTEEEISKYLQSSNEFDLSIPDTSSQKLERIKANYDYSEVKLSGKYLGLEVSMDGEENDYLLEFHNYEVPSHTTNTGLIKLQHNRPTGSFSVTQFLMPNVVPVKSLEEKYLYGNNPNLRSFLFDVQKYWNAFHSREAAISKIELEDPDLLLVYDRDRTSVTFVVSIGESKLEITLTTNPELVKPTKINVTPLNISETTILNFKENLKINAQGKTIYEIWRVVKGQIKAHQLKAAVQEPEKAPSSNSSDTDYFDVFEAMW